MATEMNRYDDATEVDAVIVGTGPGGATVLARLAQAGLRVVALEKGPWHDPRHDFATDEAEQTKLYWNDERLSAGSEPVAFGKNNSGTGVGGTSLHWTCYAPRPQPDDFVIKRELGVGVDWPVAWADLLPYWEEVEDFLGVSGPTPYPWGPPRRTPYVSDALPANGPALIMKRGCDALGIPTAPAPNGALSAPHERAGIARGPCTQRGFCQAGCTVGAKASMDVTYVALALNHGAEVRPHSRVVAVERGGDGRVTSAVYVDRAGVERRQRCKALFLSAGAIETPRLLLHWNLATGSGQVGRNFMAHPAVQVWGVFDEDTRPAKGVPAGLISEHFHRVENEAFVGGYLLQSLGCMPQQYAGQLARGRGLWGPALARHVANFHRLAGTNVLGECLPSADNYLELSAERDAHGLPKPRVRFALGPNERAMSAHAEALQRRIWHAAGARDVWAFPRLAHTIGTCRMGDDPRASVVRPNGRAHGVPNLYVSDNSTFPSSLRANPTTTIAALGLRTADLFLKH